MNKLWCSTVVSECCGDEGVGGEEARRAVWVYFNNGHFQIVCPKQRLQLLRMAPDIPGHLVVVPHGEDSVALAGVANPGEITCSF